MDQATTQEGSMPTPNDKQLYLDATQEVDSGTQDPALWAKAMTLAEGDQEKARDDYVRSRKLFLEVSRQFK